MIYQVVLTRRSTVSEYTTLTVEADDEAGAKAKALAEAAAGDIKWSYNFHVSSKPAKFDELEPLADGTEDIREKIG